MNAHNNPGRNPVGALSQPRPLLVVDGDAGIRKILQCLLEMLGYSVLCCGNAQDALKIAARNTDIQLLITAVAMPVMNGVELTRKIREIQPHIRVLYHSAFPPEFWAAKGLDIDPMHFLKMPFEHSLLEERVKAILAGETPPPDREQRKRHLLDAWQVAHGGAVWHTLDDVRTCLRCRRTFTGRDVRVERGRFSKPPDDELICPTPKCFASPADWTSLDEDSSAARRSVGDECRGVSGREFWFRPRYRSRKQEEDMRLVLWDQRPRRSDPLWARPNPYLTQEIVTRCNREVGFVIYTHGSTGGVWDPKDPNRPESLRQAPIPQFHPVTRIESIGSYYRRRLPEFFIITVELKMLPHIASEFANTPPGQNNPLTKMQSREADMAARQAIEEAILSHLASYAREVDINGFTGFIEMRQPAGWQPLKTQSPE